MNNYQFNQQLTKIEDQVSQTQITPQEGMWAIYDLRSQFEPDTIYYNRINDVLVEPSTELTTNEHGAFMVSGHLITADDVISILMICHIG